MRILAAALMTILATSGAAIAGSVSGQALDESGAPLAGVNVEIVYQTYNADQIMGYGASVKAETRTGEDGRYNVDISTLPPGEYAAHAYTIIENGGRPINIDLVPDNPSTFAGNDRTVRNFSGGYFDFTEDDPYGNGGIFVVNNMIGEYEDLSGTEVTLQSLSTARTIVKKVRSTGEGLIVSGVPFGAYRASVKVDGVPKKLSLFGPGYDDVFLDAVEHDFTMGGAGNQFRVQIAP